MAFPTTSVLDDFAGTLANWTTPIFGDQALVITGAQVTSSSATLYGTGVWTASFAADQEVYFDLPTVDGGNDIALLLRVQDTSSNPTSYILDWDASGNWSCDRVVAGVTTGITSGVQVLASGDAVGMSIIGAVITGYYKASGGAWVSTFITSDGGIVGAGQIGCSFHANTYRGDNFGGGAIGAPPVPPTPRLVSSPLRF